MLPDRCEFHTARMDELRDALVRIDAKLDTLIGRESAQDVRIEASEVRHRMHGWLIGLLIGGVLAGALSLSWRAIAG